MTDRTGARPRPLHLGLGCVVAVLALFASAEISHQYLSTHPPFRHHVGVLLAVAVLIGVAMVVSWAFPLVGAPAGAVLLLLVVVGQLVWGGQYMEVDPLGLDPKGILAFGSQQLTSAALVPALVLPAMSGWLSTHVPLGGGRRRTAARR